MISYSLHKQEVKEKYKEKKKENKLMRMSGSMHQNSISPYCCLNLNRSDLVRPNLGIISLF